MLEFVFTWDLSYKDHCLSLYQYTNTHPPLESQRPSKKTLHFTGLGTYFFCASSCCGIIANWACSALTRASIVLSVAPVEWTVVITMIIYSQTASFLVQSERIKRLDWINKLMVNAVRQTLLNTLLLLTFLAQIMQTISLQLSFLLATPLLNATSALQILWLLKKTGSNQFYANKVIIAFYNPSVENHKVTTCTVTVGILISS